MAKEEHNNDPIERLLQLIRSGDAETRGMATVALGQIEDDRAVEPLIGLLADRDYRVKIAATQALASRKDDRAIEPIITLMQDTHPEVRSNAVYALAQKPDPRAFAPLVTALFDVDNEVRRNASAAVGQLEDERAIKPLLELLNDEYAWVRANACWSLGVLNATEAVDRLTDIMQNDTDDRARANAAVALGEIGERGAIAPLVAKLASESRDTQLSALIALGTMADGEALEPTLGILQGSSDEELRATAAWALGQYRDPGAFDALVCALSDPYEWVRAYAIEGLALLGDERAQKPLGMLLLSLDPESSDDERIISIVNRALAILAGEAEGPIFKSEVTPR